jgi:hypothetical protein
MAYTQPFVVDNSGAPDQYVVQQDCLKIYVRETNRTLTTQASFNVYIPATSSSFTPYEPGEPFIYETGFMIPAGSRPFAMATSNVATATFSVREQ